MQIPEVVLCRGSKGVSRKLFSTKLPQFAIQEYLQEPIFNGAWSLGNRLHRNNWILPSDTSLLCLCSRKQVQNGMHSMEHVPRPIEPIEILHNRPVAQIWKSSAFFPSKNAVLDWGRWSWRLHGITTFPSLQQFWPQKSIGSHQSRAWFLFICGVCNLRSARWSSSSGAVWTYNKWCIYRQPLSSILSAPGKEDPGMYSCNQCINLYSILPPKNLRITDVNQHQTPN